MLESATYFLWTLAPISGMLLDGATSAQYTYSLQLVIDESYTSSMMRQQQQQQRDAILEQHARLAMETRTTLLLSPLALTGPSNEATSQPCYDIYILVSRNVRSKTDS